MKPLTAHDNFLDGSAWSWFQAESLPLEALAAL
jgi:hypothetical protein